MIKLLIGGSPCTHWSIAQTKDRETEPEGIGWELFKNYLIALEKYKPDYFLYENNKSMSAAIREQITQELGVEPMPNAAGEASGSQSGRIYSIDAKSVPLQARPNGGGADGAATGLYAVPAGMAWRGRGDGSAYEVRDDQKANAVTAEGHQSRLIIEAADGKTYPVYEVKDGRITIKGKLYPIKLADGFYIIRKLTVTECKRLQTVPESYVFPVSDTQAYKMLGNGWTVDVIAHILSYCKEITTEPIEVLSMYDGMSCGHIALDQLGATISKYYSTEIDKYAIQTTQYNYPDTIQLGDAFDLRRDDWELGKPLEKQSEEDQETEIQTPSAPSAVKGEEIPVELPEPETSAGTDESTEEHENDRDDSLDLLPYIEEAKQTADEVLKALIIREFEEAIRRAGIEPDSDMIARLKEAPLLEVAKASISFAGYIAAASLRNVAPAGKEADHE